jgi:hypothetical protein
MKQESEIKLFKKRVESYLDQYRHMSLLLVNSNNQFIKNIFSSNKSKKKQATDFVNGVNIVLNAMKKEYADLLINFHVKHKSFEEMGYSKTSFYFRYKEALKEFIQIIE